jgi:hypothetical protein
VREGWEESCEGVVCCYAGGVEVGDGVEEMLVCGGIVEAGRGEDGHVDIGKWVDCVLMCMGIGVKGKSRSSVRVEMYWWVVYVVLYLYICICICICVVLVCLTNHLLLMRRIEMVYFIRRGCLEATFA